MFEFILVIIDDFLSKKSLKLIIYDCVQHFYVNIVGITLHKRIVFLFRIAI